MLPRRFQTRCHRKHAAAQQQPRHATPPTRSRQGLDSGYRRQDPKRIEPDQPTERDTHAPVVAVDLRPRHIKRDTNKRCRRRRGQQSTEPCRVPADTEIPTPGDQQPPRSQRKQTVMPKRHLKQIRPTRRLASIDPPSYRPPPIAARVLIPVVPLSQPHRDRLARPIPLFNSRFVPELPLTLRIRHGLGSRRGLRNNQRLGNNEGE